MSTAAEASGCTAYDIVVTTTLVVGLRMADLAVPMVLTEAPELPMTIILCFH